MAGKKRYKRPPLMAGFIFKRMFQDDGSYPILGDMEEEYNELVSDRGIGYAKVWYWTQLFLAIGPHLFDFAYWRSKMFRENLKLALRNIIKHKGYSLLNISGLAVGLACSIVIILYVTNELTYDNYHNDSDHIYRITTIRESAVNKSIMGSTTSSIIPAIKADFPQVEYAARAIPPFENRKNVLVHYDEKRFYETRTFFIDPEFLEIFDIPLVVGETESGIQRPGTVVITESTAEKYFGKEFPIGKTLAIEFDYDWYLPAVEFQDFEVIAVVKDAPKNTHLKYDMLVSVATMKSHLPWIDEPNFDFHAKFSYIKFFPEADVLAFEKEIQVYAEAARKRYFERTKRELKTLSYPLQKITDIHMNSEMKRNPEPNGNWYYLYVYSIIASLILLIGCMNFMNLSAALSTTRTKEVGLRKVVGAQKHQLIWQFLGESFLITLLGFIVAFSLVGTLLPAFNEMAGTELTLANLNHPIVICALLGLIVIVSIGSGAYPAFILTNFRPISVLRGRLSPTSKGAFVQKTLVIGQFTISLLMVISTVTIYRQLDYMKSSALGFDREQKMIVPVKSNLRFLWSEYEMIKGEFLTNENITGATVSSGVPGKLSGGYYLTLQDIPEAEQQWCNAITLDYDYVDVLGLKIVAGRNFDPLIGNDINDSYIINETAAREMGFNSPEEAIGHTAKAHYHGMTKTIVGVIADFHYHGMQEIIEPMVLDIEDSLWKTITLSVNTENLKETIKFAEAKWEKLFPGIPFEYSFLDDDFNKEYLYEEQAQKLLSIVTTLGLSIACLGLFGLAAFTAHRRKKEIGIRKVLGASTASIISLLSRQFIFLVIMSSLIATPIAWFAMHKWLQDFAYHINIGWVIFAAATISGLAIALLTVSIQGIRAASSNPVESIRSE